ncbi:hypothetical protein GQ53DRAFT_804973 [Thozetella sp. PMI_491]|nr:hypothetical protein GQ53DRAFT_804973 [Thozetella sp. PMI_491]
MLSSSVSLKIQIGPQPSADTEIVDSLGGMKLVEDTPDVAVWHIGNLYFRVLCNRDDSSSYDAEHANGKTLTCIPESSYSFGVSKLLHAHQSRGRTYMIHCPPTGKPLEAMWPTLSNTLRDRYDEEVTAATKEFAQNTGLRDFLPHLEGDPESEVYELTVEEKLKVDRRIALGQQLVREHLQDTWAARELVCILPQASIECGRGPAENLEFGDVAVVPEGVVVTAHGIGVTSFQIVGMSPMGSERVVRTVVCPMAYNNGSCEGLPPLQHSRGVLKKRRAHNTPIIGFCVDIYYSLMNTPLGLYGRLRTVSSEM